MKKLCLLAALACCTIAMKAQNPQGKFSKTYRWYQCDRIEWGHLQ